MKKPIKVKAYAAVRDEDNRVLTTTMGHTPHQVRMRTSEIFYTKKSKALDVTALQDGWKAALKDGYRIRRVTVTVEG